MPITPVTNFIQGKDMVLINADTRLFVSKLLPLDNETPPEFGQTITLAAPVAANDTDITVEPLIEGLPANKVLDFGGQTVTTTVATPDGVSTIKIAPAPSAIAAGTTAVTGGVEQVITLAADVALNDTSLSVAALTDWVEKGRVLQMVNSGAKYEVTARANPGATSILIKPSNFASLTGDTATVTNYEEVCSINQADDSTDANVLQDRNFKSGDWTSKRVTSRSSSISCNGFFVKGDFGLTRIKRSGRQTSGINYFILTEGEGGEQFKFYGHIGQNGNNRQVDQNKQVSFTIEVDGELYEASYPLAS